MKTFVFFIGGTGARVLRSLTMLMASGIKLKNDGDSIVPILIDFDAKNADLTRSNDLLGAYNQLHSICDYAKDRLDGGFFKHSLGIEENGQYKEFGTLAKIAFAPERSTFGGFIGYEALDTKQKKSTKMLIDSLYDNSPVSSRDRELNLELKYGFKGNPNIGSVVFNEYFKSQQYQEFKDNFNQGDRIFIVASIFGGTGSSGLPQIVRKVRENVSTTIQDDGVMTAIREAMLGACVVLPYFKVKESEESAINSLTFNSKAKAALSYYHDEINKLMSEVYYIGCDSQNVGYDNIEGGEKQENNAHLVELLSAMSIIEFANHNEADPGRDTQFFEYTSTTTDTLSNPSFLGLIARPGQGDMYQKYIKNLNAFALLCQYFKSYTLKQADKWKINMDSYYKNLEDFLAPGKEFSERFLAFANKFIEWINEMQNNSILGFHSYNFDRTRMSELVKFDDNDTYSKIDFEDVITRRLNETCAQGNNKNTRGDKDFLRNSYTACWDAVGKIN